MQERYLGDIHDFVKFFFIKFLSLNLKKMVGLNWYLINTDSPGPKEHLLKDGEQRKFLKNQYFKSLDPIIFNELYSLKEKKNRKVKIFERNSHLQNYIKFFSKKIQLNNRDWWFKSSLSYFKDLDIIFLDADNGLIAESINDKSKKSIKYIKTKELLKLFNAGKTIIFTQFQSYSKKHTLMLEQKVRQIKKEVNLEVNCPILRNRSAPNTFYISIVQKQHQKTIEYLVSEFSKTNNWTELIKV